jgi:hypothetical protein
VLLTLYPIRLLVSLVAKIWLRGHHADSVGVTHTASPSLHAHDLLALGEDTKINGVLDTPLETAVDVLLPWRRLEVRLLFREQEWVDTTVKVGILRTC